MSRFSCPPFFVVGSVRSGTTMLRQILERHPALVCPEETHLFRWPHPFGTPDFRNVAVGNRTLKRHREIDGIDEDAFDAMLNGSLTRRQLIERYMEAYAARRKPEATRWFEKSPQNVYGIQLIQGLFPEARFLHLVRHPLEVVSSLKVGKVMKVPSIVGAANYWLEAVSTMLSFARGNGAALWQARYEDFTGDPERYLESLFAFLDEPFDNAVTRELVLAPSSHREHGILTDTEIAQTWAVCGELAASFGYACWPSAGARGHAQREGAAPGPERPAPRGETARDAQPDPAAT
ncbi:MAG TPA: sulfotransferase [Thermohalobaculum sp.]|nr:sulfotransferase [Thermohalobaculum sp.]